MTTNKILNETKSTQLIFCLNRMQHQVYEPLNLLSNGGKYFGSKMHVSYSFEADAWVWSASSGYTRGGPTTDKLEINWCSVLHHKIQKIVQSAGLRLICCKSAVSHSVNNESIHETVTPKITICNVSML